MVMVSKFSNFPDELSEKYELGEYELSRSDCTLQHTVELALQIYAYRRQATHLQHLW